MLEKEFVQFPDTCDKLRTHTTDFELLRNLPQCISAIDGSHIFCSVPVADATDYHNYKGYHSMILFAAVDARYKFIYYNIGAPGRKHDAGLLKNSEALWNLIINDAKLDEVSKNINGLNTPAFFIGDSAFPLLRHLMKPYAENDRLTEFQIAFNKRLSAARIVVENSFGRLKARFRALKRIDGRVENIQRLITCACILHNICESRNDNVTNEWLTELRIDTEHQRRLNNVKKETYVGRSSNEAKALRNNLANALYNY